MRYSIHLLADGRWELRSADGTALGAYEDQPGASGYNRAAAQLGSVIKAALGDAGSDVLLPETWESVGGVAFSERLPGGRDFTDCAWSWRDPQATISPLMLLTEETDWGHLGAQLAGFTAEFTLNGGTVDAHGGFFNQEYGIAARDLLAAAKESGVAGFGVSVGPTENIEVEVEEECTQWDDDGFCEMAELIVKFLKYEIGSLTICAPAGFDKAVIALVDGGRQSTPADTTDNAAPARVAASLAPARPPRPWFAIGEPKLGEPFLDGTGDDFLVDQEDGQVACPMQISPAGYEGLVFGNLARWGDCHAGDPLGPTVCVDPPHSPTQYAHFHVGHVVCDDGTSVATGALTVGCDHAPHFDAQGARDHYANSGLGWADVHVIDGDYGPWAVGALRPNVTEEQVRLLRALVPSGDWVKVGGELELVGTLMVNTPGYAIAREVEVLRASANVGTKLRPQALKASMAQGQITKLVAAGIVRRCPECEKRRAAARFERGVSQGIEQGMAEIRTAVMRIERRTRHLIPAEAAAARARLAGE